MKTQKFELPQDCLIRTSDDVTVFARHVAVMRRKVEAGQIEVQLLGPSGQCLATARGKWAERLWLGWSYHFI